MARSKYDVKEKQLCLINKYDRKARELKKVLCYGLETKVIDNDKGVVYDFSDTYDRINFMKEMKENKSMLDCGFRINESKKRKRKRIRSKIADLVQSEKAVFLTITFNDSVLASTSPQTRRRYVARFLKDNCDIYVANIDFGSCNAYKDDKGRERIATEREHYHALIGSTVDLKSWKYGIINAERVKLYDNASERVSRYIAKISNHAIKTECFETRLIYSRNVL